MINNARINSGHIAQQCDDFRRIQVEVIAIADRKFEGGKVWREQLDAAASVSGLAK